MASIEDQRLFVKVLNTSFRHKWVTTKDEFVMVASLEARLMSPSKAKQVLNDMLKSHVVEQKGDYLRLDGLWDDRKKEYVVKSQKTGKVLKSSVSRPSKQPKRTVRYLGPGHTVVDYEHRTLHIRFNETKKEFERKRSRTKSILVDKDSFGNMIFISKGGSNAGLRARSISDRGKTAILRNELSRDKYTIEDMRAILRDDHWEEVCGHKRWNYDNKSTVREFKKYLKTRN